MYVEPVLYSRMGGSNRVAARTTNGVANAAAPATENGARQVPTYALVFSPVSGKSKQTDKTHIRSCRAICNNMLLPMLTCRADLRVVEAVPLLVLEVLGDGRVVPRAEAPGVLLRHDKAAASRRFLLRKSRYKMQFDVYSHIFTKQRR